MIAKATVITHGSNAVRYSVDKEMAEIVMVNHLIVGHVGTDDGASTEVQREVKSSPSPKEHFGKN